jgi:DNA-binding CsgD family transcriptional regulator/tetratricopeptide (TPR) repeat protein
VRGRARCPVTIGRDQEVRRLREAWDDAFAGAPGLVLIRGEAGIGKSRLVDELMRYVRESDGSVLIGSCSPFLDGVAPYAPIRDALEPLVAEESALADRSRKALERTLFPDSMSVPSIDPEPGAPDLGQGRAFSAIRNALLEAALQGAVLLIIEDLHWADISTLQLLSTLERGLRHSVKEYRLLVVLTCRLALDGRDEQIVPFLHEFRRSPLTEVVDLLPLDGEAAAQLLTVLFRGSVTAERLAALAARADGNPFLLEELADAGDDAIPDGVREMLELRLRRLPNEVPDVLRAAAVLGSEVEPDLLAGLVDVANLRSVIDSAVQEEVLVAVDGRYYFRHALVREVLLSQLFESDRRRLHDLAAAALVAQSSDRPDGARIAYHCIQAGNTARALIWSFQAGAEAERLGAVPEALGHYERALALLDGVGSQLEGVPDRSELTYRTGLLAESLGQHARGAELLGEAATLFAQSGDVSNQTRALVHRGYALCHVDIVAAMACCDEALALLDGCPPTEENALLLSHTGSALLYTYQAADALPRLTRAAELAARSGSAQAVAAADLAYGLALSTTGRVEEGMRRLRSALQTLRAERNPQFVLCAYALQLVLARNNALEDCVAVGLDALDTVAAWGGSQHWWVVSVRDTVANAAYKLGSWDLAATQANLALELTQAGADTLPFTAIAVHIGRGELEDARDLLRVVRSHPRSNPGWKLRHLQLEAELAIMEGHYEEAHDAFREGMHAVIGTEAEAQCGRMLLLGAWAAADRTLGEWATGTANRRGIADLTELQSLAAAATTGPCGTRPRHFIGWNEGVRTHWGAELARLGGQSDPAKWVAAAERWRRLSRPYFEGYCLLRAVEAANLRGAPTADVENLFTPAVAIANRLRAAWLQRQLQGVRERMNLPLPRAEVAALGGSDTAPASTGPVMPTEPPAFGLTSREREVLALLATGLTNAQLASQLFISTHTANVHVSRILMKLGVPNRTQAASLAWAQGLIRVADASGAAGLMPA